MRECHSCILAGTLLKVVVMKPGAAVVTRAVTTRLTDALTKLAAMTCLITQVLQIMQTAEQLRHGGNKRNVLQVGGVAGECKQWRGGTRQGLMGVREL